MGRGERPIIVAADIADIDLISPLWEQLNEHNKAAHKKCFGEDLRETWEDKKRELRKRSEQCQFKFDYARSNDTVVGYCISSINMRKEGEIISLFVLPEFRRGGVGSSLMRTHILWLRESGAKSVFLYVHPCNIDAIRFYWRFHFFSSSPLMEFSETDFSKIVVRRGPTGEIEDAEELFPSALFG